MKRIVLTIVCVLVAFFAQAEGHMTFKGIEIDGDLPSFVAKLEEQGFTKENSVGDDFAIMTGTFTTEDVYLIIHATPISKVVYSVSVVYNVIDSWPSQESHYRTLASSLRKKYGAPIEEIWDVAELFTRSSLGDGYSTARTCYRHENGGVSISIERTMHRDVSTRINYWDKANNAKNREEIESDL